MSIIVILILIIILNLVNLTKVESPLYRDDLSYTRYKYTMGGPKPAIGPGRTHF